MNTALFVENSFVLTPKEVLHNLRVVMGHKDASYTKPPANVNYWLEDESDPSVVLVTVDGKEPQRITVEFEEVTFGARSYFRCDCGHKATKLYLPPCGARFACRKCHGLQYQLASFDRHSVAGRKIYRMNRLHKLSNSRASMGRIFYNGKYTKKFERFIGLCDKAGLDSIVQGANDLKTLLNG